jgi:hypothetical protein
VLISSWLEFRYCALVRAEEKCLENAHALQLDINRQIIQQGEESIVDPSIDLASVTQASIAKRPEFEFTNPFTQQPGRIIVPGESCRPGDLLIVAADAYFFLGYTDPAQEEISAIYPGFYVIALGIRPRADIGFPDYLDLDEDGNADPIIGWSDGMHINRGSSCINVAYEPLTEALQRQGVQIEQVKLQSPRVDYVLFWRYMLGFAVY